LVEGLFLCYMLDYVMGLEFLFDACIMRLRRVVETLRYLETLLLFCCEIFMKTELCMVFELLKAYHLEPYIYLLI
jgi:hypothetical protein